MNTLPTLIARLARRPRRAAVDALPAALAAAPVPFFIKDVEGRLLGANSAFGETVGAAPATLVGQPTDQLWSGQAATIRATDRQVLAGASATAVHPVPRADGEPAWLETVKFPVRDAAGTVTAIAGLSFDVTERVRLAARLRQVDRLETLGQVAGGAAHDLNNALSSIAGFAGFLLEDLPPHGVQAGFARRIAGICREASAIARRMVAIADPASDRRRVDLRREALEAAESVRPLLSPHVTLRIALAGPALPVDARDGDLYRVIANLCVNARDSLATRAGVIALDLGIAPGTEPLAASQRHADEAQATGGALEPHRRYARLTVGDDGAGMDQATADRIFEPFFSTKSRAHGTGLGLATVRAIVIEAGGAYRVRSRPGRGTEVTIYWPLPTPDAPSDPA